MSFARANSFVVFPIGRRRFALPAEVVSELAQPDAPLVFPHTTPLLIGVLVRRGRVVPVCDVAKVLVGPDAPLNKFYVIAKRQTPADEWIAIPVTGECELVTGDMLPRTAGLPEYVTGLISVQEQSIEVVDLEKIMDAGGAQSAAPRHVEVPA